MSQRVAPNRSLSVWPFLLIGVGVVWLLAQAGILTGANLSVLFRLWPVVLIAIGVELLVGRNSPSLGTLIGVGTVILLVVLMLVGPSIGLAANAEVVQNQYDVPLDAAEAARVEIQASVGHIVVEPLSGSGELFTADIESIGAVQFDSSDEGSRRIVSLTNQTDNTLNWFNFLPFFGGQELNWNIGLNDSVPLDLTVSTGTGAADLDLTSLQLTALNVSTGTGSVTMALPAQPESYNAVVTTGTGSAEVNIAEGADLSLRVSSGTGGVDIDVPDNAAVRLVGSVGTGGIDVPAWMQRVGGDGDRDFIGQDGQWQTAGFDTAEQQIIINFSGGTGGLSLR